MTFTPVSVDYFFEDGSKYEAPQGNVWLFLILFLSCYLEAFIIRMQLNDDLVDHFEKKSSATEGEVQVKKIVQSELNSVENRKKCSRRDISLKTWKQQSNTVASNSSVSGSGLEKDGEVREFLEHLISTLIAEDFDDVPLTPLSNDEQYETIVAEYHPKLSSTLTALSTALHSTKTSEPFDETTKPSNLCVRLKLIINEISEKAALLPVLSDYDNDSKSSIESQLEGQSYEDILSTAVLNKIISKYQNRKEPYTFADDLNVTSAFEYKCNSWNSSPKERLSLMVEEHVEEITTRYQSSEDDENESVVECLQSFNPNVGHRAQFPELGKDIVDVGYDSYDEDNVMEIVSNVDSWEDNWLFQKKKKNRIKTVAQVSVPMLVPNPSEKYRALIGDVDVDETSDLSECSDSILVDLTEFDDIEKSEVKTNYLYKYDFKNHLDTGSLKGKLYDDSDNYHADHDQDSSGVTSISRDISDIYSFSSLSPCQSEEDCSSWNGISEAKNRSIFLNQDDSGEGSLETQPETEEFSANECDRISDCGIKSNKISHSEISNKDISKAHGHAKVKQSSPREELARPPKPGTIAEREHLKWQQAAPLPNNPYSKENIEKRSIDNLYSKGSSSNSSGDQNDTLGDDYEIIDPIVKPDIKKYERDYYVNTKPPNGIRESENNNGVNIKISAARESNKENGFPRILPKEDEEPVKKQNLVRVLSWSERKHPEVDVKRRLPSVKELAKQFSEQPNHNEVKPAQVPRNQMVHSLTARSMSREFREGLRNNINKTYNRNVMAKDGSDKAEDSVQENGILNKSKLDDNILFWENI